MTSLAVIVYAAGIDLATLARRTGLRREFLSRVVHGHRRLGPGSTAKIATAFGLSVEQLVAMLRPGKRSR